MVFRSIFEEARGYGACAWIRVPRASLWCRVHGYFDNILAVTTDRSVPSMPTGFTFSGTGGLGCVCCYVLGNCNNYIINCKLILFVIYMDIAVRNPCFDYKKLKLAAWAKWGSIVMTQCEQCPQWRWSCEASNKDHEKCFKATRLCGTRLHIIIIFKGKNKTYGLRDHVIHNHVTDKTVLWSLHRCFTIRAIAKEKLCTFRWRCNDAAHLEAAQVKTRL